MLKIQLLNVDEAETLYRQAVEAFGEPQRPREPLAVWEDLLLIVEQDRGNPVANWWATTAKGQTWLLAHQPTTATVAEPAGPVPDTRLTRGRQ